MEPKRVAVIGAGNGGKAMAADLGLRGHTVCLFEFPEYEDRAMAIQKAGGIRLTGVAGNGFVPLPLVTTDIAAALEGADVVFVATQAQGHRRFAELARAHLVKGQVVVLFPGSGGTLEVAQVLGEEVGRVMLGEASTLPYACRSEGENHINIHRVVGKNFASALPSRMTGELIGLTESLYPLSAVDNVLVAALINPNIIIHTVGSLLNVGRIEFSKGEFYIYKEGITPSVQKVVEALDSEKQAVLSALGVKPVSYYEATSQMLNMSFEEFARISSKGPFNMQDRYITEDVPNGLTLLATLGEMLGVSTPTADSIIHLFSTINGVDYRATGRSVKNLGLSRMSLDGLRSFLAG